jgi:hypothetical protein
MAGESQMTRYVGFVCIYVKAVPDECWETLLVGTRYSFILNQSREAGAWIQCMEMLQC